MATVQRFEDLTFWQKSRELTRDVYRTLKDCRDHGFKDQIQRASVSVMSNIAEGFERGTRQEFVNYLYIAKGETGLGPRRKDGGARRRGGVAQIFSRKLCVTAGEVRAQLYVAHDVGYITDENFKTLKCKVEEVSKLLSAFIKGVKSSPHHGLQRKSEKTKQEEDAEEFLRETRRTLSKIHPHLYTADGRVK